jgi:hypothetical protein
MLADGGKRGGIEMITRRTAPLKALEHVGHQGSGEVA